MPSSSLTMTSLTLSMLGCPPPCLLIWGLRQVLPVTYFTCDPRGLCAWPYKEDCCFTWSRPCEGSGCDSRLVFGTELTVEETETRGNWMWTKACESWSGALICVHGPCLHANIWESGGQGTEQTRPRGLLPWTPHGLYVAKEAAGGNDPLWVPGSHESCPESHNPNGKKFKPLFGTPVPGGCQVVSRKCDGIWVWPMLEPSSSRVWF